MALIFQWDSAKAITNAAKHGVTFEEAASAFGDPLSLTIEDAEHSHREKRYILLGQTFEGKLVVVAHTERPMDIRIISARMSTKHERRAYESK
jgi:uncharacterized DUF497 family protein